jgi:hypothetical protein
MLAPYLWRRPQGADVIIIAVTCHSFSFSSASVRASLCVEGGLFAFRHRPDSGAVSEVAADRRVEHFP